MTNRWIGVLLLLASCASRSGPVAPPHEPRAAGTLTVMTYNVNFGMAGDTPTLDAIRDADADLVFLQETNEAWEVDLRRELGGKYPHMDFRHCCRAGGLAVLSRHPFVTRDYIPASSGWFPAWRVIVTTPVGELQVLNVHLHPPVSESGSVVSGYFSTQRVRRAEIEAFFAHVEAGIPTLVVGDFNEDAGGDAIAFLRERGFDSALPRRLGNVRTWHWRTSLGTVSHQLDHIVHDRTLDPLDVRVIEAGRSDHFPVVASFALSAAQR